MKHLIRAELHKTYDTRTAKVMIAVGFLLACLNIGGTIYMGKYYLETNPAIAHQMYKALTGGIGSIFGTASISPITFLGLIFIFLICQEWCHDLATITYVAVPKRSKILIAKLCALLISFVVAVALLTLFSLIVAFIISKVYEVDYSTVIHFNKLYGEMVLGFFFSVMLATAMAYFVKNQTWALLFYLFLPFLTILITMAPFIDKIAPWIALGSVPSLLRGGLPPHQEWYHILVSVVIWIVIPLVIGVVRSMKEDI